MHDGIIKNAKLIDGSKIEVAWTNNKLSAVAEIIDEPAKTIIDLKNEAYLSPGWIDDHVHCYEKMTLYYDTPDEVGVKTGVTTIIDAGTTGAENIGDFYEISREVKTNVYGMLNISKWGIVEQDELADLTKVQADLVREALETYPDFIVGIKARMSKTVVGENGITPLELAKEIQQENQHIPLMVHVGSAPPELAEVLARMEKGDIMTHCFNGKPNGILDQGTDTIKDFAWDAYKKGVIFDIGHGTDSFNFHVAEIALKEGMKSTSISTDIYHRNRETGPVYDLATTMEKLHVVGYSWKEILDQVTRVPAENFHLTDKGSLEVGKDADLTIFDFKQEAKELTDSNGNKKVTDIQIQPLKTIIGGMIYDN